MKAVLGAAIVAAGVFIAVMIRADEAPSPTVSGPVVAPLGRPTERNTQLQYPTSVVANAGAEKSSANANPPVGNLFSKFSEAAPSTSVYVPPETDRPLRFPAVYAAIPATPAAAGSETAPPIAAQQQTTMTSDSARGLPSINSPTTNRDNPTNVAASTQAPRPSQPTSNSEKPSPWRPIQAAFKQLTAPIQDGAPSAAPTTSVPSPAVPGSTTAPNPSTTGGAVPPEGLPSVKVDALPPWKTVPQIDPNVYPSQIIMEDGGAPPPGFEGYIGGPSVPKSECGYCRPAPAFGCCTCQSVKQGGPGCNCGSNGFCANCGGSCGGEVGGGCEGGCAGKHGHGALCGGGQPSNWVNSNGLPIAGTPAYGSCVLQRLACCLCAPYPDCSNGCVDFCHSWIFHEDCHWCTSNHKCCHPGCPEHVYGGCSNGTGGCGCGCAECVPPPDLYFTADAMILTRNNEAINQPVATQGGGTLLSTGDFDFVYEVGPSFTFGYRPTPWDAWEFSYFGLMDWDSRQSLAGAGDLNLPGALGAALDLNFANADLMNVTYSSVVHNAEANYLWSYGGQFMWMLGFRYFHLGEDFDISSTGLLGSTDYRVLTRNNLYGGQIGARYRAGWNRFNWDIFGKAGVYGNDAEQRQLVANVGEAPIRDTVTRHGSTAFVGDVGVNLTYRLSKCWSVRGGYNAIWVEDVALAPNQLDFTDTLTSGTMLNSNGGVFLHGAHAGIGCRW